MSPIVLFLQASDPRYRVKEDFAIVLQPFLSKSRIPKLLNGKTDFSYVSTDCFHFSQRGSAIGKYGMCHMGYRWKGPFKTYYFCIKHFLLNPIFTGVKFKIKNLLKRNLPTPVGSAERNFLFLK